MDLPNIEFYLLSYYGITFIPLGLCFGQVLLRLLRTFHQPTKIPVGAEIPLTVCLISPVTT